MYPFKFKLGDRVTLSVSALPYDKGKVQGVIDTLSIDRKGTYASVIWNKEGRRSLENELNLRML